MYFWHRCCHNKPLWCSQGEVPWSKDVGIRNNNIKFAGCVGARWILILMDLQQYYSGLGSRCQVYMSNQRQAPTRPANVISLLQIPKCWDQQNPIFFTLFPHETAVFWFLPCLWMIFHRGRNNLILQNYAKGFHTSRSAENHTPRKAWLEGAYQV